MSYLRSNLMSYLPGTTTADLLNCFCEVVDRRGALSIFSNRDHYQRFSPLQTSDMFCSNQTRKRKRKSEA